MDSLTRSRAALLIKWSLPARVRRRGYRREAPASLGAPALLDRGLLADGRRAHRVVDDVARLLDLRRAVRADVDVRRLGGRRLFALDFDPLFDHLALFHVMTPSFDTPATAGAMPWTARPYA